MARPTLNQGMGTALRAWARVLAALLFTAALTGEALAANYSEYANATLQNQLETLRVQRNLYKFVTDPGYVGRNAYFMAEIQTNQTMTQNWSYRLYTTLADAIYTNSTAQANLNLAFLYLGQNGSQLYCGNASGGNCKTGAGSQGRSRVGNETIRLIRNDPSISLDMARLRAELFKYWATWYVHTQRGVVALLNMASG